MDKITEFAGYKLLDLELYHRLERVAQAAREFVVLTETPIRQIAGLEEHLKKSHQAKEKLMTALEDLDE